MLPWVSNDVALYDTAPLRATLERLVDFDRLNSGEVRFSRNSGGSWDTPALQLGRTRTALILS